jgi:hypothetical protein
VVCAFLRMDGSRLAMVRHEALRVAAESGSGEGSCEQVRNDAAIDKRNK